MAARLKVFVTSDGLTDYVVAVSSKAKALAAWGSHQDLFKTGSAHETEDAVLVKAATAKPGEVLRKPAGTRGELAKLKPAKAAKPAGPSKAQLRKVAELEAKLAALSAAQEKARAKLETRRATLEREAEALEAEQQADRRRVEAALSAARQALG
jgi:Tfp pilus assembly protein FimV